MTKAIILAAGSGQRLRPYTDTTPKCLIEIAGRSLLDRQIEVFLRHGIDDITVVTGHAADKITDARVSTRHSPEFDITNMVYSLFAASDILATGEDVIVSYGDIVYEHSVLAGLIGSEAPISISIDVNWRPYWESRMTDPLADAETLRLDDYGNVIELGKRPSNYSQIQGQYIGLIKFDKVLSVQLSTIYESLDSEGSYDGRTPDNMYMTSFLQLLIDSGWRAGSAPIENGWLELDTTDDLKLYESMIAEGTLSKYCELY